MDLFVPQYIVKQFEKKGRQCLLRHFEHKKEQISFFFTFRQHLPSTNDVQQ